MSVRPAPRVADIDFTLRKVFGKQSFRNGQRAIIEAVLAREDVFVQAATSFGKSLCYQLPAVIDHGITMVVSPLLALMGNQVAALQAAGVPVATINSTTVFEERSRIVKDLSCGHPHTRLLYVTPELVMTESFRKVLAVIYAQGEFSRVAVDEAHCISEWGHEFRPAYHHLSYIRSHFPRVPIICLTATATPTLRTDIVQNLGLNAAETRMFIKSTTRRNLHYRVEYFSDDFDDRLEWISNFLRKTHARRATTARKESLPVGQRNDAVSGIIYVSYRAECDALANQLRRRGFGAAPYHAGLSATDRTACQQKWLENALGYDVIVATTAFGMGIDKRDVRFVIHWRVPQSFEGYYQEAGRAGRDGKAALCQLFYSREDRIRVGFRLSNSRRSDSAKQQSRVSSFRALIQYCERTERCRHQIIGEFFGEQAVASCDACCDVCQPLPGSVPLRQRKEDRLSSEEWASTQTQRDAYVDEYD